MESHKFETFAEAAAFAKKRQMGDRNISVKIHRTGMGEQRVVDIIMVEQKTLKITEPTLPNDDNNSYKENPTPIKSHDVKTIKEKTASNTKQNYGIKKNEVINRPNHSSNQVKVTCQDCEGIGRFPYNSRCARCNGRGYHLRDEGINNIAVELYDKIVIAKRMKKKSKEALRQAGSFGNIPEYEDGAPRSEFGTRNDFKKERARQWGDMKNRYRG